MRKYLLIVISILNCCLFISCSSDTAETYFGVAVLNTNKIVGFANNGLLMQLESPSVKMSENNSEPVPMKRSEVINSEIEFIESNIDKLKSFKETDDTKEMISASLALHEYILPVYKNEYMKLAGLFDSNAPDDQIKFLDASIREKYSSGYKEKYNKLIETGKKYAEKNNIKVNWGGQ